MATSGSTNSAQERKNIMKTKVGYLTINQTCAKYELSAIWVRRMILKKILKGCIKEKIEGQDTQRWLIPESEIIAHIKNNKRNRRDDGRNKFNLYATSSELSELKAILTKEGKDSLLSLISRANPPKSGK